MVTTARMVVSAGATPPGWGGACSQAQPTHTHRRGVGVGVGGGGVSAHAFASHAKHSKSSRTMYLLGICRMK